MWGGGKWNIPLSIRVYVVDSALIGTWWVVVVVMRGMMVVVDVDMNEVDADDGDVSRGVLPRVPRFTDSLADILARAAHRPTSLSLSFSIYSPSTHHHHHQHHHHHHHHVIIIVTIPSHPVLIKATATTIIIHQIIR